MCKIRFCNIEPVWQISSLTKNDTNFSSSCGMGDICASPKMQWVAGEGEGQGMDTAVYVQIMSTFRFSLQFGGDSSYLAHMNPYIKDTHEKFK